MVVFGSKKRYSWGSKLLYTGLNHLIIMAYEGVNGLYIQASHLGEQAIYAVDSG